MTEPRPAPGDRSTEDALREAVDDAKSQDHTAHGTYWPALALANLAQTGWSLSPSAGQPDRSTEDAVRDALEDLRQYVKSSRSHPTTFRSGLLERINLALALSPSAGRDGLDVEGLRSAIGRVTYMTDAMVEAIAREYAALSDTPEVETS